MSGLNLYELSSMLRDAVDAAEASIDHETGEIPADWAEFLDAIEMERTTKLLNCGALYKSWDREAEAIRTEERVLAHRRHTLEAKADSIKRWMAGNMQAGEKLNDSRTTIGWRKSTSVEIVDPAALPAAYVVMEPKYEKKLIGDALKDGQTVPGARMITNNNIQIK